MLEVVVDLHITIVAVQEGLEAAETAVHQAVLVQVGLEPQGQTA